MNTDNRKTLILSALRAFINQRSGIEFGNYGDVKAFRAGNVYGHPGTRHTFGDSFAA
jgi:hypothetical protein